MLCALCLSLFSSGRLTGSHHSCLDDLLRAAQSGCKICICLARKRGKFGPDPENEQSAIPFLRYKWALDRNHESPKDSRPRSSGIMFDSKARWLPSGSMLWVTILIHVSAIDEAIPDWYTSLSAHIATDLDSQPWRVRREMFPLRPIADNTGHESVLRLGKTWLEHCYHSHKCERSNRLGDSKWYPKRLISLTDPFSPRLLETNLKPPNSRYATLSHCWGSEPNFITLNTKNLDDLCKGIPINTLPQSFRDAIRICSHLSIHYLWIDSLCIIQDSESDWLLHTEEMASIYQNCFLNLSFDAARNPWEGAFRHRNTDILQECCAFSTIPWARYSREIATEDIEGWGSQYSVIPAADVSSENSSQSSPSDKQAGNDGSLNTNGFLKCLIFAPELESSESTSDLPLSSRGWVVQERLLSPRVLHFTQNQIMWECEECPSLHEALPHGILGTGKPFDTHLLPFSLHCFPGGKPHSCQKERFSHWNNIVQKYSGCLLTYPDKDKVVAFAAIAQRFSPFFGEEYYAGHFRQNLPFDLVWHVPYRSSDKKSPKKRYPTWSWTSIDSKIAFYTVFDRPLVEIEDVSVTLVDPCHRYGPVKSGQLNMRCLIVRCVLGAYQGQRKHNDLRTVHMREIVGHSDHFSEVELIVNLDGPEREILEDVYFIPVLEFRHDKIRDTMGLILLKQADGFYRRAGSWNSWINLPDMKSGPMFEVVDKFSDCHQVVVIV